MSALSSKDASTGDRRRDGAAGATAGATAGDSRREQKKRDKEARIRQAAMALFRDKGYHATTTREVARKAGIAAGTLFLYVETKEELVDFVFAGEIARVVDEAWRTLPRHGDLVPRLMHLFGALIGFYAADVTVARVLVAEAILPRPGARSAPLTFDFLERLGALVAAAQEAGQLTRAALPLELALHAFQLYVGGILMVVNGYGSADDARRMIARALEVHLLGLRPPPPRARAQHRKKRRAP